MRVCLLSPSAHRVYRNIRRSAKRQPMLGPAYIAAALRQAGHDVAYLDCDGLDLFGEQAAEAVLATDPELVGISFTTPLFSEAAAIARALRAAGWNGHLTLGGVHPTSLPDETLNLLREADSVVLGEGELSIVQLAEAVHQGQVPDKVAGLLYRAQDGSLTGIDPSPQQVPRLDDLPLPALDLYPVERYTSDFWGGRDRRMGVQITTRGCPYRCEFCASGDGSWGRLRYHSVDRVVAESLRLRDSFGADYLVFNDDTFTVKPSRCLEITQRLKAEGVDLPFMVTARVDTVDDRLLGELAQAGCFMITYGVESGSNDVLRAIGKQTNTGQARTAVALAQKHGIKVVGNYMFGHYPDDEASCEATLELARDLACDVSQFSLTVPYPGTQLYRQALAEGRLEIEPYYDNFGYYGNVPWRHPRLDRQWLLDMQQRAYRVMSGG